MTQSSRYDGMPRQVSNRPLKARRNISRANQEKEVNMVGQLLSMILVLALSIVGALFGAIFIAVLVGIIVATIRTVKEEGKKK